MQSIGLNLIAKIIEEARLQDFNKLQKNWFMQTEFQIYEFIENYIIKYGALPSLEVINKKYTIEKATSDSYGYFYDEIRQRFLYNSFESILEKITKSLSKKEVNTAFTQLKDFIFSNDISSASASKDVTTMADLGQTLLDSVIANRSQDGLIGIPTGWDSLDKATFGYQGGRMYILVARPKAGKSMILSRSSMVCHDAGFIPLVVSMEMSDALWTKRFYADKAKLNMSTLNSGKVSTFGEKILENSINIMKEKHPYYFIAGQFKKDLNDIKTLIIGLKPSIVYIDGGYLIKLAGTNNLQRWDKMTTIAEELTSITLQTNIPIVVTFQFNREVKTTDAKKAGFEHIQLSDALAQVASLAVGIFDDDDTESIDSDRRKRIEIIGGRELEERKGFYIRWRWDIMNFDEIVEPNYYDTSEVLNDNTDI